MATLWANRVGRFVFLLLFCFTAVGIEKDFSFLFNLPQKRLMARITCMLVSLLKGISDEHEHESCNNERLILHITLVDETLSKIEICLAKIARNRF